MTASLIVPETKRSGTEGDWTVSTNLHGVTLEVTLGVQIGVGTLSTLIVVNGWGAVIRPRT